jgi:tetratricopeptide (TPR) repeat protein
MTEHSAPEGSIFDWFGQQKWLHYLLSYLVAAWSLTEFLDWLVQRFHLSPEWTNIVFFFSLLMLPAVVLLILNQLGKSHFSKKIERGTLFGNFALALGILLFAYRDAYLGVTSDKVTVTDEKGKTTERMVTRSAYAKRLAVMPWETEKLGAENWLYLAGPAMLETDLDQDIRLSNFSPFAMQAEWEKIKHPYSKKASLNQQKQIAEALYCEYFTKGKLSKNGLDYQLALDLYHTDDLQLAGSKVFQARAIWQLNDLASVFIRERIFSNKDSKVLDLPLDNLLPNQLSLLKTYYEAMENIYLKPAGVVVATQQLEQVVNQQPNFAKAHLTLALCYTDLQQGDKIKTHLDQALEHASALPERDQLSIKYHYYYLQLDQEKTKALLKMWIKLYPHDVTPYAHLIKVYASKLEYDKAKKLAEDAIKAGHLAQGLTYQIRIASAEGDLPTAIAKMQEFRKAYPNKHDQDFDMAILYQQNGDFKEAQKIYEDYLVLYPNDKNALNNLAMIQLRQGKYQHAEKTISQLLNNSNDLVTAQEKHFQLYKLNYAQGKIKKAHEHFFEALRTAESHQDYGYVLNYLFNSYVLKSFAEVKQFDLVQSHIDRVLKVGSKSSELQTCFILMNTEVASQEAQRLEPLFNKCQDVLRKQGGRIQFVLVKGYLEMYRGHEKEAAKLFEEGLAIIKKDPNSETTVDFMRCLVASQEQAKAIAIGKKQLRLDPSNAQLLLVLAQAYWKLGNLAAAKEMVQKIQKIWAKSDENFRYFQEFQALKQELELKG